MYLVSSISWLENDLFFVVYTPNEAEDDAGMIPDSDYYIIERRKQQPFLYRQLPLICAPFGLKRSPAYHFTARLSNYNPDLKDALIISSTASTDIGLATRVTTPFKEADATSTNVFTTTTVMEETRRATLPLNADSGETSTIGLVLDLTGTETVSYDVEKETKTPLPNIMVLTNGGVLSSWWFLHLKAIEAGLPYSAAATASAITQQSPAQAPPSTPAPALAPALETQSSFGKPAFGHSCFWLDVQIRGFTTACIWCTIKHRRRNELRINNTKQTCLWKSWDSGTTWILIRSTWTWSCGKLEASIWPDGQSRGERIR